MPEPTPYCRTELHYAGAETPLPIATPIWNGRTVALPGWETCGFELIRAPSSVGDFTNDNEIAGTHFDEIELLAKSLTGCDAVLFYPPLLRSPERAAAQPDLNPIELVHSDYTESYRAMIEDPGHPYHHILEPSMRRAGITVAEIRQAQRILTLQLWRNVGAPKVDYPLSFCDARTVARTELVPIRISEYGGQKTEFDAFAVLPPSEDQPHAWYVFPNMTPDEVVVFRAYDSDRDTTGEPFWTPHVSFRDPNQGADVNPRTSLEMRAICLFRG